MDFSENESCVKRFRKNGISKYFAPKQKKKTKNKPTNKQQQNPKKQNNPTKQNKPHQPKKPTHPLPPQKKPKTLPKGNLVTALVLFLKHYVKEINTYQNRWAIISVRETAVEQNLVCSKSDKTPDLQVVTHLSDELSIQILKICFKFRFFPPKYPSLSLLYSSKRLWGAYSAQRIPLLSWWEESIQINCHWDLFLM